MKKNSNKGLLSSGVIVTDYYTVTAILRLPDVTLIDVLTPKKHIEFIFTKFLAFFSFTSFGLERRITLVH